jgi:catechol 2,3-dioxygenase-like lactoylglutathione lyase family enzyme
MSVPFQIRGVHHVALVVEDLASAREFYCDGLGLEEIARPAFDSEGFWVQVGSQQLHVSSGAEIAPTRNHFAVEIVGLDDAVQHLTLMGIEVRRLREVEGAGAQAFVRDPWGNLIELNEQC